MKKRVKVFRDGVELRRCSRCEVWKPKTTTEFPVMYLNADGQPVLMAYCIPCNRAASRDRYYADHAASKERYRLYMRGWRRGLRKADMERAS